MVEWWDLGVDDAGLQKLIIQMLMDHLVIEADNSNASEVEMDD